jgi:hypothetical protein
MLLKEKVPANCEPQGGSPLECLWHPGRVVHRPRQRFHFSSSGAGTRRSQNPADVFDARETEGPRPDRTILFDRRRDVPVRAGWVRATLLYVLNIGGERGGLQDDKKSCGDCGAPLKNRCRTSGAGKSARQTLLRRLRGALSVSAATAVAARLRVPANRERRHLTVLFCDLVGSTEITAQLDPEEWRDVAADCHRAAAEAINRFAAHVAKYLGDGITAISAGLRSTIMTASVPRAPVSLFWRLSSSSTMSQVHIWWRAWELIQAQ